MLDTSPSLPHNWTPRFRVCPFTFLFVCTLKGTSPLAIRLLLIFLSLKAAIVFIQSSAALSDGAQRFLDADCGNGFTRHRTHKEETETERRSRINYHQAFIEPI